MDQAQKKRPLSFAEFYAKESPIPFYVMMGLFVLSNMLLVINYTPEAEELVLNARRWINVLLLWLCPMYFAFNLILWQMKPWTMAVGAGAVMVVFAMWNFVGQYYELFCTVVAAILALLAYRRDFKTILKIVMIAHLVTVLAAIVGLKLGYAVPRYKLGSEDLGISLGLVYPNHLARLTYIVMTIAWYLWGQERRVLTTVVFWALAAVMWIWVKCRTNAILMVALPICWWATTGLLHWKREGKIWNALHEIWNGIMILMPFVMFTFTYVLGKFRVFLDSLSHFGTGLYSMLMRFISAGILFQAFGFPLWGRNITEEEAPWEFMNGHIYMAGIIDNSYVYYFICLGVIVLALVLAWLCVANWRAVQNGDHALLLISVFMLGYGLIEVITFQFEHNFMWFYPLTATALAAASEQRKQPELTDEQPMIE
ncbi:MAG: hypothetical protein ACSW8J_00265 [bacterium]